MAIVYRSVLIGAGGGVPDGKTVLPVNDVQIWIKCAQQKSSYTTLAQVLADTTLLTALIQSNNACDYLARSTAWASDVCADSTAMTIIGANNYCADTLLADSTWFTAICDSTYFESVLNVKVPVMTSNTTPSGECTASSYGSGYEIYKAFDGNSNTACSPSSSVSTGWVQYQFTQPVSVKKVGVLNGINGGGVKDFDIMMSTDGTNFETLLSNSNPYDRNWHYYSEMNDDYYSYFRLNIKTIHVASQWWQVSGIQFYGREKV